MNKSIASKCAIGVRMDGIIDNGQSCRSKSRSDLLIRQNTSLHLIGGGLGRGGKQKFAFSLIELLISLIAISCIIAAFAPVISKKISTGSLGDARISTQCKKFETNLPDGSKSKCKLCLSDRCLLCGPGTRPDVQGVCQLRAYEPTHVAVVGGLKVMQRNIGDDPIIDRTFLERHGVTVVEAGQSCDSTNKPCCWVGNTADQTTCNNNKSKYSGCHRTLCNWQAANKVCESIGWELPTEDEILSWRIDKTVNSLAYNFLTGYGSSSLELCNHVSSAIYPRCSFVASVCIGSPENNCHPYHIWSKTQYGDNIASFRIYAGDTLDGKFELDKTFGFGARCVQTINERQRQCALDHGATCIACTEGNDSKCTACVEGYFLNSSNKCIEKVDISPRQYTNFQGLNIMTRNIGDDENINADFLRHIGINVVEAGDSTHGLTSNANTPMCWTGKTAHENACNSNNSDDYSGCNRTVCDWYAANLACEAMGWRLPTKEEIEAWRIKPVNSVETGSPMWDVLKYSNSSVNLRLCAHNAGVHPQCNVLNQCFGSVYQTCWPAALWAGDNNSAQAFHYVLWDLNNEQNGQLVTRFYTPKSDNFSARCVKGSYPKCVQKYGAYCSDCDNSKCTKCSSGYTLINDSSVTGGTRCVKTVTPHSSYVTNFQGLNIMQRNIGDDPNITPNVLRQWGINVVNAGESCSTSEACCWTHANNTIKTAGECRDNHSNGYPACYRTYCNRIAAKIACQAMGWRLPTIIDVHGWRVKYSTSYSLSFVYELEELATDGTHNLNFCNWTDNGIDPYCGRSHGSLDHFMGAGDEYLPAYRDKAFADWNDAGGLVSVRCVSGQYPECVQKYGAFCSECDNSKCTKCSSGYTLINDESVTGGTRCVKTVAPAQTTTFQGLNIMQRNIGDDPNITPNVLRQWGINVVNAGETCTPSATNPCCWVGNTAGACDGNGCNRPVCDWWAGNIACQAMGKNGENQWRIPTVEELAMWRSTYSLGNGSCYPFLEYIIADNTNPFNLCTEGKITGVTRCDRSEENVCLGASPGHGNYKNRCQPANLSIHGVSFTYGLTASEGSGKYMAIWHDQYRTYATSVRCVSGDYNACTKKHGILCQQCNNDNSKCLLCVDGAHMSANTANPYNGGTGLCVMPTVAESQTTYNYTDSEGKSHSLQIMKYNAGDSPLLNKSMLSKAGITLATPGTACASSPDHPCCWVAGVSGTTAIYTSSNCDSENSDYSGCQRTHCDWYAANLACSAIGWRLPTNTELQYWRTNPNSSTPLLNSLFSPSGESYIQLCNHKDASVANIPKCKCTNTCTTSGNGNHCCPHVLWSSFVGPTGKGAAAGYHDINWWVNDIEYYNLTSAFGVRCVKTNY